MKTKAIVALGPAGSNGHEAALKACKIIDPAADWRIKFVESNSAILDLAIKEGLYAVVPFRNTTGGPVRTIADNLFRTCGRDSKTRVIGTIPLPVQHCFMARHDWNEVTPTHVLSHEQALKQCSKSLSGKGWECLTLAKPSTSGAAALVATDPEYSGAVAIARALAAEIYGLTIIERDVQDASDNITQFAILGPADEPALMKDSLGRVRVAIVGADGGYGKWLTKFFTSYGCTVVPVTEKTTRQDAFGWIRGAEVVMFSVPTIEAPDIIASYTDCSFSHQLWLDVTSLKVDVLKSMMMSRAEVVGLHPLCAPPRLPTLRGQTMAVCAERLNHWGPWLTSFLTLIEADIDIVDPETHDRLVMERQGLQHATTLVQASVMCRLGVNVAESLRVASPFYKLLLAAVCRMHSQNPKVYAGIQIGNPHMLGALDLLAKEIDDLRTIVRQKDQAGFVRKFNENREHIGIETLSKGNEWFELMIALLSDLSSRNMLTIKADCDHPGLLLELLKIIAEEDVNLTSVHSRQIPDGGHKFLTGVNKPVNSDEVHAIVRKINSSGVAKVVS